MTKIAELQLRKEVSYLKSEVGKLRSAVISLIGEDPEGVYNPQFVNETLRIVSNAKPAGIFKGKENFLAEFYSKR